MVQSPVDQWVVWGWIVDHEVGKFMKIEIGESLGYSYLRHVKQCWLVQVNWKASEHWARHMTDAELEAMFAAMRRKLDPDGSVFKKSRDAAQFLRQGEIDVLGVNQNGGVHAMEVAFHEGGLNYGGGVANRVLKKLLRTSVSNQQKWDTLGAERSGAGWRSGELPEGPVVASSPFGGLSLHLLPAL